MDFRMKERRMMAQIERICPGCGASNPSDRLHCVGCGIDLVGLPVLRQPLVPMRVDQATVAALAIGASLVILRTGLEMFARGVLPRLVSRWVGPASSSIEKRSQARPDWIVHGWRAWSIHSGDTHSTGSERFEWRIKRTRDQ